MDGISLAAVAAELKKDWLGARVEKVYQPERDEICLSFRGKKPRLLICVNPGQARVQLSSIERENPAQAPMFCMLLRKHLSSSRLISVRQPGFDRVLELDFSGQDELGNACCFTMIIEIMGKHSNLILLREDASIVDAIKHVTPLISSVRVIMPKQAFVPAPSQGKRNPIEESLESISTLMRQASGRLDRWIGSHWSGISPDLAREIALRAAAEGARWEDLDETRRDIAINSISDFFADLKAENFAPTLVRNEFREPIACYPIESRQYAAAQQEPFDSMSLALDAFYAQRDLIARMRQRSATLQRILQQNIDRCQKKLGIQKDILAQTDKMEEYRLYGELLTANLFRLSRGMKSALLENYYAPDNPAILIPLDQRFGPNENAQRYYKKYNKQKIASDLAGAQIEKISAELHYLEGQLENLRLSTSNIELNEIREELVEQGYARPESGSRRKGKSTKNPASNPLHFISSDGADIYIGKNNAQNDRLTFRFAQSDDIWMHAKDIPGSHVIVKAEDKLVSDRSLQEAAELAAYFSKARNSALVPVDYTPRKYVKKPPGTAPGFVTFSTNRTAYVTPDVNALKKLSCMNAEEIIWQ